MKIKLHAHEDCKNATYFCHQLIQATSVRKAARKIGISPATMLRVARGELPNVHTLMRIQNYLEREK